MQNNEKHIDITNPIIFANVMNEEEINVHVLRAIFPERKIKWVKRLELNDEIDKIGACTYDDQGRCYYLQSLLKNSSTSRMLSNQMAIQRELIHCIWPGGWIEEHEKGTIRSVEMVMFVPFDPFNNGQRIYNVYPKADATSPKMHWVFVNYHIDEAEDNGKMFNC